MRANSSSPLALLYKVWVCGSLLAGIGGLSTVQGVDVACYFSVLSGRDLSGGLLMCAVELDWVFCVHAWSCSFDN